MAHFLHTSLPVTNAAKCQMRLNVPSCHLDTVFNKLGLKRLIAKTITRVLWHRNHVARMSTVRHFEACSFAHLLNKWTNWVLFHTRYSSYIEGKKTRKAMHCKRCGFLLQAYSPTGLRHEATVQGQADNQPQTWNMIPISRGNEYHNARLQVDNIWWWSVYSAMILMIVLRQVWPGIFLYNPET